MKPPLWDRKVRVHRYRSPCLSSPEQRIECILAAAGGTDG